MITGVIPNKCEIVFHNSLDGMQVDWYAKWYAPFSPMHLTGVQTSITTSLQLALLTFAEEKRSLDGTEIAFVVIYVYMS